MVSPACFPKDDGYMQYVHNRDQNCKSRIAMGMAAIPGIVGASFELKEACGNETVWKNESFLVKSCGLKIGEAVSGFQGALEGVLDAVASCFHDQELDELVGDVETTLGSAMVNRDPMKIYKTVSSGNIPKIVEDPEARGKC